MTFILIDAGDSALRKRFEIQYELGVTPIEKVEIPSKSRDELPPIFRALQYIFITPELNERVFAILEEKVTSNLNNRVGRPGMTLWEILVLAVVRLARDADYDELHYMAETDSLLRALLGVNRFGESNKSYGLQTIKDNASLIDEATINKINDIVAVHGQSLVKKTADEKIEAKVDSYVLETNVHFPTDLNLLYDAARKVAELFRQLTCNTEIPGWRKSKDWTKRLKNCCRKVSKLARRRGPTNEKKERALMEAAQEYLTLATELHRKAEKSLLEFSQLTALVNNNSKIFNELSYFFNHLEKHIDLVQRRIIYKETIPSQEKVYSLFEPHTEWINKGKAGNKVELGLKVAVATDQFGFILSHRVMIKEQDVDIAVLMGEELARKYELYSLSFDKGFWSKPNYQTLAPLVENLVMPKKGKLNQEEYEREHHKTFRTLRNKHSAVESSINCLEHHGLNRCPDKGLSNFKKYTALGILACNLHKLGNVLLEKDRQAISKNEPLRKAA